MLARHRRRRLLSVNLPSPHVSALQACNTRDLVVKKMVYLYLCSYAQSNAELTLLAINTLQKDW